MNMKTRHQVSKLIIRTLLQLMFRIRNYFSSHLFPLFSDYLKISVTPRHSLLKTKINGNNGVRDYGIDIINAKQDSISSSFKLFQTVYKQLH